MGESVLPGRATHARKYSTIVLFYPAITPKCKAVDKKCGEILLCLCVRMGGGGSLNAERALEIRTLSLFNDWN